MEKNLGKNITKLRKMRGLTQEELGKKTGLSQRMIGYYENNAKQISSKVLIKLAKALKVSTDELLELKPLKKSTSPEENKLMKNFKKILKLPKKDQQAIFHYINTLSSKKSKKE